MKSLLLVLVLCFLGITYAAAPACSKYACVSKLGASCETLSQPVLTTYTCTGTLGSYCDQNSKVCNATAAPKKLLKHGQKCNSTLNEVQCEGNRPACINDICTLAYLPGTPCSKDSECLFPRANNNEALVTRCERKKCFGLKEGAECNRDDQCLPPLTCGPAGTCAKAGGKGGNCGDDLDCQPSLFCNNTKCSSYIPKGEACTVNRGSNGNNADRCDLKLTCAPTTNATNELSGICVEMFSQKEGTFCTGDRQCAQNYYCGSNQCLKGVAFSASSKKVCTDDVQCDADERCQCDGNAVNRCYSNPALRGNSGSWISAFWGTYNCQTKCVRTDVACLAACGGKQCSFLNANILETAAARDIQVEVAPSCALDFGMKTAVRSFQLTTDQPRGPRLDSRGINGYYECGNGNAVAASLLFVFAAFMVLLF